MLGDVRDAAALVQALAQSEAEIVFHCAAQSLVRRSYGSPAETFATNVMGTVHLLDAIRASRRVRAAIVITSDKCYASGNGGARREHDPLGGDDPYSSSKACAELVTAAYRASFFNGRNAPAVATVRAGNVIGGGDWAEDRLVPDMIRAWTGGREAVIRNPDAVRPWQHVLEPLHGYLLLAESLLSVPASSRSWNFGPSDADTQPVSAVADRLASEWGVDARWTVAPSTHPPELGVLRLDSSLARTHLDWRPRLSLSTAVQWTAQWYKSYVEAPDRARQLTLHQIDQYQALS
jgi:CDP-glucose 4,6-dehydratase